MRFSLLVRLFLVHLTKADRLNISLLQTALKDIKQEGNDADLKLAGFLWDTRYAKFEIQCYL